MAPKFSNFSRNQYYHTDTKLRVQRLSIDSGHLYVLTMFVKAKKLPDVDSLYKCIITIQDSVFCDSLTCYKFCFYGKKPLQTKIKNLKPQTHSNQAADCDSVRPPWLPGYFSFWCCNFLRVIYHCFAYQEVTTKPKPGTAKNSQKPHFG